MILNLEISRILLLSIEIYMICLFILGISLFSSERKFSKNTESIKFRYFMISVIISVLFDFACNFFDTFANPRLRALSLICNIVYISVSGMVTWTWFDFLTFKFKSRVTANETVRRLLFIPVIIFILMTVLSSATGWLFTVDENGVYQRGPLFLVQMLPWIYPLSAFIGAFVKLTNKRYIGYKKMIISTVLVSLVPVVCEVFQLAGAGIPSLSIGYTVGTVFIFFLQIEANISIDSFTKFENHFYFIMKLSSKLENISLEDSTYLMFVDINKFKKMNAKYGTIEADKAITILADSIRELEKDYNIFVGRYDSDVFAIVIDDVKEIDCRNISSRLSKRIGELSIERKMKEVFSFSVGYSKCNETDKNDVSKVLERAENMLELNKSLYKQSIKTSK